MTKSKQKVRKSTKKKPRIIKSIIISDLLEKYPQSAEILAKHGFHCIGCVVSSYETLAVGAAVHNIPVEPLLRELNKAIGTKRRG